MRASNTSALLRAVKFSSVGTVVLAAILSSLELIGSFTLLGVVLGASYVYLSVFALGFLFSSLSGNLSSGDQGAIKLVLALKLPIILFLLLLLSRHSKECLIGFVFGLMSFIVGFSFYAVWLSKDKAES